MYLLEGKVTAVAAPTVSVIVPVYNGERYLSACIDSILSQTFTDMEILFVNDGSSDRSAEILAEYAARDARIRVITQKNSGVGAARNAALDACTGEYIRFIDCDDTLPPESMQVLVDKARANESDLVIAAFNEWWSGKKFLRDLMKSESTLDCNDFLQDLTRYPQSFFFGVLWNKLFRREYIAAHHIRFTPDMSWGEDFAFVMQYLVYAERVSYTRTPVYDYRRNPNGLTVAMLPHCLQHPMRSLSFRLHMYRMYVTLFKRRGLYEKYRHKLWRYMISFTISK